MFQKDERDLKVGRHPFCKARIIVLFFLFLAFGAANAGAQIKEEKEESKIEALGKDVRKEKANARKKLFSSIEVSTGYETNAKLSQTRKGDTFQEALYSLAFRHPLPHQLRFTFNYDVNLQEYDEMTDLSNLLNHFKLGLQKVLYKSLIMGVGYDASLVYCRLNEDSNFVFQKGFVYLRHNLSKKAYHQVMIENGAKDYTSAEALAESSSSFKEDKRQDDRQIAEYSWGMLMTPKLFLKLRGRFSVNDSNADFQDFYDYKSYDFSPRVSYKISNTLSLNGNIMFTRKKYGSRNVSGQDFKQVDDLYSAGLGLRYLVNTKDSLSLNYSYHQADSNDHQADYSGSGITAGWRHAF